MKTSDYHPFSLHDPSTVWQVVRGEVDLFLVLDLTETPSAPGLDETNTRSGRWHHVMRYGPGEVLWGVPSVDGGRLVGRLLPGAELRQWDREAVLQHPEAGLRHPEVVLQHPEKNSLERWLSALTSAVNVVGSPRSWVRIDPGDGQAVIECDRGSNVVPEQFLWIRHLAGASYWCGRDNLPLTAADCYLALSERAWLTVTQPTQFEAVSTEAFLARCSLSEVSRAIDLTHQVLIRAMIEDCRDAERKDQERIRARRRFDQAMMEDALHRLASSVPNARTDALGPGVIGAGIDDPLFSACVLVGRAAGIDIQAPASLIEGRRVQDPILEIAFASKVQVRPVRLRGQWFHQDNGPLVGFVEEGDELSPVALIPKSPWHYEAIDPNTREKWHVTRENAGKILPQAFMFYRSLPSRQIAGVDLFKHGFQNVWKRDLLIVVAMGMAAGALGMLMPIITGDLFDRVIPQMEMRQLGPAALLLISAALGTLLFEFTRNIAMLRIEGRLETAVQSSILDRLVNLSTNFFRGFAAGDLAIRAMGISAISQAVSGVAITTILTSLFTVFSFGLLFYFDRNLAWIASLILAASFALSAVLGVIGVKYQRRLATTQGRISALVFQIINGINKFRMAGAEERAFSLWAKRFSEQRKIVYKVATVENIHRTMYAVLPVLTNLVLFAAFVGGSGQQGLSTGRFLAFMAAFGTVNAALGALSSTLLTLINVVPYYERVKPILESVPEMDPARDDPGPLTGEIELSHVSFRYDASGPWIIDGVSFYVRPGEFVAIVGPSGQGKSTLLRLLLGFEKPDSGAIYFDGKDLATLDLRAVRRQIGVVLQDGVLSQGDIYSNIVGTANIPVEEAWEAAQMAGIAEDIEEMPMGMRTMIPDGGGTLSGGQRQRLLIARALVRRPRILLFDEATSALDNETQAIVMRSLAQLRATRIVVAHRLSTVIHADRILVLHRGRIVQHGTYDELIAERDGLFAKLVERQLA